MAHGGKRAGAGRKVGSVTAKSREVAEQAASEGLTPLAYMLKILRDEDQDSERRDWAAEKAAPYVHARLAAIEAKHDVSDALADLLKAVNGRTRGIPSGA
jgi:uncharacterized protein YycO